MKEFQKNWECLEKISIKSKNIYIDYVDYVDYVDL